MNEQELFILAENTLTKVIDQIKEDQWQLVVSGEISEQGGTLRSIVNYHAYDDAWVPDTLAGKTIEEVGGKYDGDLLGDDPKVSWHAITDKAIAAVKALDNPEKKVYLTYGEFPACDYLWHIATFRMLRAVSIARFIGVDDTLPPELIDGMMKILEPNAEQLRQWGVFTEQAPVSDDASAQDKLLALTGLRMNNS